MIRASDLREYVIRPTLSALGAYDSRLSTEAAVDLLLGTAAQESDLGYYLTQDSGPALGIYQIESATHTDVKRYLAREDKKGLREIVRNLTVDDSDNALVGNLYYATAIARVKYWMAPEPLPDSVEGQADYWKLHYNTVRGRGTREEYLNSQEQFLK